MSRWENLGSWQEKCDQEATDRVVRLVENRTPHVRLRHQSWGFPGTQPANGFNKHTVMVHLPVQTKTSSPDNARLRREVQELRDTNELLKATSAFVASELDPQRRK